MDPINHARFIFVTAVCLYSNVEGDLTNVCAKTDTSTANVSLNCNADQMIHVISELYGRRTSEDNCTVIGGENAMLFKSDSHGLNVNCNGYDKCTEPTQCGSRCESNTTGHAFEISYECVEGSRNICSFFHQSGPLPSLYLHSPRFPSTTGGDVERCECSVSGPHLEVMVVQHIGLQGVIQMKTSETRQSWNISIFNRWIASSAKKVIINYNNKEESNGTFWIKIQGNIINIKCNMTSTQTPMTGTKPAAMANSSTTTPNSQPTTLTPRNESTTTTKKSSINQSISTGIGSSYETSTEAYQKETKSLTMMIVSVMIGVINFLLLIIVLSFIFLNVKKQKRDKERNAEADETAYASGSDDTVNTYSDLNRNENQNENYGNLNLYADAKF